eukprot:evm.model.scf_373.1 EVM.evm.TU.scf_373.1   scf_373:6007-10214(-)
MAHIAQLRWRLAARSDGTVLCRRVAPMGGRGAFVLRGLGRDAARLVVECKSAGARPRPPATRPRPPGPRPSAPGSRPKPGGGSPKPGGGGPRPGGNRPSQGGSRSSEDGRGNRGGIKDKNRAGMGVYINEEITAPEVRLLGQDKDMLGVMPTSEALERAREEGVDLILVSPNASPPVCRLLEWGKYKYMLEKESKEKRKKQRDARVEVKELKMRPGTDTHDYNVRLRKAQLELSKGNRVKVMCQFRGREHQFREMGYQLLERFIADLGEGFLLERRPHMEGGVLTMLLAPEKK